MGSQPDQALERLRLLRRGMDRILREMGGEALAPGSVLIPVDVFETPNEIRVEAEVPGLDRSDLELYVLHDILVLEGRKAEPPKTGGVRFVNMERSFGGFRRIIELPQATDMRSLEATLADGVLTVRLPRIEDRRGRKRKVDIQDGGKTAPEGPRDP